MNLYHLSPTIKKPLGGLWAQQRKSTTNLRDQLKCGHIFSFISFYDFYPNRKKVFSHFYPTRCAIDFFGLTHTHTRADRVNCHWIKLNTLKRLKLKNFQHGRRNYVSQRVYKTSINLCVYIYSIFSMYTICFHTFHTQMSAKKASRLPGKYESCWQTFMQRLSPVSAVSGLSFWPGAVPQPWLKYEIHQGCC